MAQVNDGLPANHPSYNTFRLKAAGVKSKLEADVRARRGRDALLQGLLARADYTNDLLLALLNDSRNAVSFPLGLAYHA